MFVWRFVFFWVSNCIGAEFFGEVYFFWFLKVVWFLRSLFFDLF